LDKLLSESFTRDIYPRDATYLPDVPLQNFEYTRPCNIGNQLLYVINNAAPIPPSLADKVFCSDSEIADAMPNCSVLTALGKREEGNMNFYIRTESPYISSEMDYRGVFYVSGPGIVGTERNNVQVHICIHSTPLPLNILPTTIAHAVPGPEQVGVGTGPGIVYLQKRVLPKPANMVGELKQKYRIMQSTSLFNLKTGIDLKASHVLKQSLTKVYELIDRYASTILDPGLKQMFFAQVYKPSADGKIDIFKNLLEIIGDFDYDETLTVGGVEYSEYMLPDGKSIYLSSVDGNFYELNDIRINPPPAQGHQIPTRTLYAPPAGITIVKIMRNLLLDALYEILLKGVGDLYQEINVVAKWGGYINNYKADDTVLDFINYTPDGNLTRMFVGNDRPSYARFFDFMANLKPESRNLLAFGGFYGGSEQHLRINKDIGTRNPCNNNGNRTALRPPTPYAPNLYDKRDITSWNRSGLAPQFARGGKKRKTRKHIFYKRRILKTKRTNNKKQHNHKSRHRKTFKRKDSKKRKQHYKTRKHI
jgi:hypothetical protein